MQRLRHLVLVSSLALSMVTAGAVTSHAAVSPDDVPADAAAADRVAGGTRSATAARAARRAFPDGVDEALIARSDAFPDALAAAYLAGVRDVPILLTDRGAIPSVTLDAIEALGVERVTLLGGTGAIPTPIEDAFKRSLGDGNVDRIGGGDRFETASVVSRSGKDKVGEMRNLSDPDGPPLRTVVLALGTNFPDALSAGPLSFAGQHPILLTRTDRLPTVTSFTLQDANLDIEQVIVAGGEVAVSDDVFDELKGMSTLKSVVRVAGGDRTATAVALGELTRDVRGWDADTIAVATGANFPDALTLSPLAARNDATLFLTLGADSLGFTTFEGINALCGAVETILVSGGPVAVSDEAAAQAQLATACADAAFPLTPDQVVDDQASSEGEGTGYVFVDGDVVCHVLGLGIDTPAVTPTTFVSAHHGNAIAGDQANQVTSLPDPSSGYVVDCASDPQLAALVTDFPAGHYVQVGVTESISSCGPDGCGEDEVPAFLRGQLVSPFATTVALRGDLEVTTDDDGAFTGLTADPAAGQGQLILTPVDDELCFSIDVAGLDSPTAPAVAGGLHLHEGAVDQNGPVVAGLGVGPVGRTDFLFHDCIDGGADLLAGGDASGVYANLHTTGNPAGALRGQLGGVETSIFGAAEIDDSTPDDPQFGSGAPDLVGDVTLHLGAAADGAARNVCVVVTWPDGLPDGETIGHPDKAEGLHVHEGLVDQNGPVRIAWDGLDGTTGGATCTSVATDVLDAVLADLPGHYVNVHSSGFVGGIARGQVLPHLAAVLTGAAEVDPDGILVDVGDATAIGTGRAYAASDANPDVVCGSFATAGLAGITGAHIHDGDAGENGPVVVGLSSGLPAGVEAGFGCATDVEPATASAIFTDPDGFYVNVHTEDHPQGAVRGQLTAAGDRR